MDGRVQECQGLTTEDVDFLHRVEAGLRLTADISRADILLCCLYEPDRALIVQHAVPRSMTPLYTKKATGQELTAADQPLILRALRSGNSGSRKRDVFDSGAPIFQDVQPIFSGDQRVIGALAIETNMIAHERQRRRNRSFRQAIEWLQQMCARGELECARSLSRFGLYDGIYLVDGNRTISYMNGVAGNMFRSIGFLANLQGKHVSNLEPQDEEIVEALFDSQTCLEQRTESDDGRVWIRKALPIHVPQIGLHNFWQNLSWQHGLDRRNGSDSGAAMVLLHNATDAVEKQRELNVKSAIIQEVHHRVKNNLQTIASILRMQARRSESGETQQGLTSAANRVLSMSVIHEFLSQEEQRSINIRDVCQRIADQVSRVAVGPEQEIEFSVQGPVIRLPASQATPMAMVVNELLLNALEHGLAKVHQGHILIDLSDLGDAVEIVVQDDGSGLPPDFDPGQSSSLGFQIVHTLVTDDLKGNLRLEQAVPQMSQPGGADGQPAHSGVRVVVTFPKRSLQAD